VMLTPHPLLVPWSRKGRAMPLLPLWAVRPVQSLSACTRVHFTCFYHCISPKRHKNTAKGAKHFANKVLLLKQITTSTDPTPLKQSAIRATWSVHRYKNIKR